MRRARAAAAARRAAASYRSVGTVVRASLTSSAVPPTGALAASSKGTARTSPLLSGTPPVRDRTARGHPDGANRQVGSPAGRTASPLRPEGVSVRLPGICSSVRVSAGRTWVRRLSPTSAAPGSVQHQRARAPKPPGPDRARATDRPRRRPRRPRPRRSCTPPAAVWQQPVAALQRSDARPRPAARPSARGPPPPSCPERQQAPGGWLGLERTVDRATRPRTKWRPDPTAVTTRHRREAGPALSRPR